MSKIFKIPKSLKTIFPYLAFIIPVTILVICYASMGIYWGSDRTLLASDAFSQFSNFHASLNNVLKGKESIFYTWNSSLGLNYWALMSYYLGGIFTPLVIFFKNINIPDAIYFLTLLKIGLASVSFWFFSKNTFKLSQVTHVALAVSYSLMSYITAHSELIMWLDAFIYLPLVFLGVNRLLTQKKPILLFVSYFLLFVSNYYFGFMIGTLSFLYFFAQVFSNWNIYKNRVIHYFITSFLAGGASMVMVLPTILDLQSNGEGLNTILMKKTEATGVADFFIKNMIGVFDTTKYQSIPFIYIGLIPLTFFIFYFISRKIQWKQKLFYLIILIFIMVSFYFEPLNLFWHGFHSPNMFLFRYSFTLSFMVILLAGHGLEVFQPRDSLKILSIGLSLIAIFSVTYACYHTGTYEYLTITHLIVTILFILIYLALLLYYRRATDDSGKLKAAPIKIITTLLLLLMTLEAGANTYGVLHGVKKDWNYPTRNLYSEPYPDYSDIINKTKRKENDDFYRMESLNPTTANESINYNFHSISQFSSVRNRNSAQLLEKLGFRSRGANANTRYENNTLLMDSIFGIKYNLSKNIPQKFGFTETDRNKTYQAYQNKYAIGLGVLAPSAIHDIEIEPVNVLSNQTKLVNTIANQTNNYYTYSTPVVTKRDNVTIHKIENSDALRYKEEEFNKGKILTMSVTVPKGKQAYLKLQPTDFNQIKSSTAEITVNGEKHKTQIKSNGIYYNLGSYEKETQLTFTLDLFGTNEIDMYPPTVVFLDLANYKKTFTQLQEQQVDFKTNGRHATAQVDAKKDQVLFTTIPYDKGWTAYVDGKKVPIKAFNDALITIPLTKGKHQIKLTFLPQGLLIGLGLMIICFLLFLYYLHRLNISRRYWDESKHTGQSPD